MVRGIGIDIIEIARIRQSIERLGEHFTDKVFTSQELAYSSAKQNKFQHLAARFAAKEAVGKALSTGWSGEFRWKDVEVMNDPSGQPRITLSGKLREILSGSSIYLSISHSDSHVVAMVVIEDAGS
jgi:holo-[acyl-carrier protein] synthase